MSSFGYLLKARHEVPHLRVTTLVMGSISLLFVVLIFISIGTGAVYISPQAIFAIIGHKLGLTDIAETLVRKEAIFWIIRLPRVVLAVLIGAALGISGASIQGIFRNPLAAPDLIGISGGAAVFAAAMIIFQHTLANFLPPWLNTFLIPIAAFIGGIIATVFVYRISSSNGKTNVATMLLAGIAINALSGAGIGYLIFTANDNQLRDIAFWTLGSLGGTVWTSVIMVAPFILLAIILLPRLSKGLNAMLLGEDEAGHLGINTEKIKHRIIILVALAVGTSVSVAGIIGFVGLVVPHLLRLMVGPDHRLLLPGSAILGACLLLISDLIARTVVAPAEIPIGIITASIGAPFFLWLLIKNKKLSHYL